MTDLEEEPERERWEAHYRATPERDADFETLSGEPVRPLYTPDDISDLDYERDLGYPGRYPFTPGKQVVDWKSLDGTLQTDILKEYIAQKEWIFPPRPHLRLIGDLI